MREGCLPCDIKAATMSCLSCFSSTEKKLSKAHAGGKQELPSPSHPHKQRHPQPSQRPNHEHPKKAPPDGKDDKTTIEGSNNIAAQTFSYRELATATKNFRQEYLLGEGGFGRVYRGYLDKTGQMVAVKQLDRNGLQGNREFLVEVLMLSLLHHPNLVNLIGYCADGEQRLLVYEYMPLGSLEDHLLDIHPRKSPLSWSLRMKIALQAAKGLEYLHDKANPPVIYRDLKSSNILLDKKYNAKLSDFGLAKLGPVGDKSHVSTRVMGTYGYCAPEYQKTGQLTVKSDVYSFGVVLLELITGKRSIDTKRTHDQHNLVLWAEPIFKDPNRYQELADPLLQGDFPKKSFNQAVAIAAMCLQDDASIRPFISDVVTALSSLMLLEHEEVCSPLSSPPTPLSMSKNHQSSDYQSEITTRERQRAVAEAIAWGKDNSVQ